MVLPMCEVVQQAALVVSLTQHLYFYPLEHGQRLLGLAVLTVREQIQL
jgi:hypothetical protein